MTDTTIFAVGMIIIGVLLLFFFGLYMKRKQIGRGLETTEKRIYLYCAIGIGLAFILGGIIVLQV